MEKTKEERDREWETCRHCGITKTKIKELKEQTGKYSSNYVMDGQCKECRNKKENESDFEEAELNGTIRRDDSIMCPYCGYVDDEIEGEQHNCSTFDCPECEKESNLEVEYTSHFTTTKK